MPTIANPQIDQTNILGFISLPFFGHPPFNSARLPSCVSPTLMAFYIKGPRSSRQITLLKKYVFDVGGGGFGFSG